jgi:lysophospholipid acyltransferase (LPLAT)-like uncharacterized protein
MSANGGINLLRSFILPRLIYYFYRLLSFTWRVQLDETHELKEVVRKGKPLIFAHWHRDELAIVQFVGYYKIATMTSTSKDGQLIDYVVKKMGGATSKGSSTRGGASALIGLTKLMRDHYRASMAVDGPKGPIFKVKPGVFELSKLADAYIAPVGVASSRTFIFEKAWNKARLPGPFSKITCSFGPLMKWSEGHDTRDPKLAENLARFIDAACEESANKL